MRSAEDILTGMAGAVLAADIIPTLIIKATAPFWAHLLPYKIRVAACAAFSVIAFLLTGFAPSAGLRLLGVACASVSSGWGEVTFLALAAFYPGASVLTAWSSGTGVAGVAGSGWYLLLHTILGVPPALTLKLGAAWAAVYLAAYLFLLPPPAAAYAAYHAVSDSADPHAEGGSAGLAETDQIAHGSSSLNDFGGTHAEQRSSDAESPLLPPSHPLQIENGDAGADERQGAARSVSATQAVLPSEHGTHQGGRAQGLTLAERAQLLLPLWVFMLPLFLVYAAEYVIQTGINSALEFPSEGLPAKKWYVIAGFLYQLGVFLSRSSGTVLRLKYLWPLPAGQLVLLCVFLLFGFDAVSAPAWLVGILTFGVGLFGGATCKYPAAPLAEITLITVADILCVLVADVNAFRMIHEQVEPWARELSLGTASVADTLGIVLAAGLSIPLEKAVAAAQRG